MIESKLNLVSETVLQEQGAFKKVRRFYKGWHPSIPNAVLIGNGYQGKETKVETTIIKPSRIITVK